MEINGGKDKCRKCVRKVTTRQDAFECDECGQWMHRTCGTSYTHAAYVEISRNIRDGIPFEWICDECKPTATVHDPVQQLNSASELHKEEPEESEDYL